MAAGKAGAVAGPTVVMQGKLRLRQGVLGFYILGETWPEKPFVLIENRANPRASVFGACNAHGNPVHSTVYASEITSVQAVRNGRFMDDMGTMIRCRHPMAFEMTYSRGNRSHRLVLAASDATELHKWITAITNVLVLRDQASRHVGYPAPAAGAGYPGAQVPHAGAAPPAYAMASVPSGVPPQQYPATQPPGHPYGQPQPPAQYAPMPGQVRGPGPYGQAPVHPPAPYPQQGPPPGAPPSYQQTFHPQK